jgi:hypothetical protein
LPRSVWVKYEIKVCESKEEKIDVPKISDTLNRITKKAVMNQSNVSNDAFFLTASAASVRAPSLFGIKIDADSNVPIAAKASK